MQTEVLINYDDANLIGIINEKYKFYNEKIRITDNIINGARLKVKRYPEVDVYCGTFFHIITKDYLNKDITCCPNRIIKCIRDFKYNPLMASDYPDNKKRMICPHKISTMYILEDFFLNKSLLIWEKLETTPRGKRTRVKLLDLNNKYLVILEKRKNGDIYYWTSYPVDYSYKIEKLKKEYNQYRQSSNKYILDKLDCNKQGTPIQ